jgi:hypothetical protein
MYYMVQLSRGGCPVTDPSEAVAALDVTDPGHGPVEPEDPSTGTWQVVLTPPAVAQLEGERLLMVDAAGYQLIAEMP